MITLAIDLNLMPIGVMPRLNVSQYDHGQEVTFVLWNGNVAYNLPAGTSVYIEGTKPDGTGFTYECTLENNQPVATITEQMTAVAGCVDCELVMLKDSARQGTINFILDVEPAALRADVPISETDIPIIERIPEIVAETTAQAQIAEAWATGGEGGEASETNNAKYWAEQSQSYAVGALHWKGNTTFANIPTANLTTGDVYNVTDAFTTDSRFNEGAGIECEAGTNIIYGSNGKWDVQAPPSVHSFNGRKGAVVPASGDYTGAQVTSNAIAGKATVDAALGALDADLSALTNDIADGVDLATWAVNNFKQNSVSVAHYGVGAVGKPSNPAGFIQVFGVTSSYIFIVAYSLDGNVYVRFKSQSWSGWLNMNATANTFGTDVNIKSYNSSENAYICPSDGYIQLNLGATSDMKGDVYVNGILLISFTHTTAYPLVSLYVKKGMRVYCLNMSQSAGLKFFPLV